MNEIKYILATHNQNKIREMSRILAPIGISVVTDEQMGMTLTEVEETGTTFEENARLKSRSGCAETGLPCIADDSGLEVDHLGGRPGVYSARYSGGHGNDASNIGKLLHELDGVPDDERTAHFTCCICCTYPDGEEIVVTGKCEGKIGYSPIGEDGFGYDPVFVVGDKTFAQMSSEEKDKISHRGNALREFVARLKEKMEV